MAGMKTLSLLLLFLAVGCNRTVPKPCPTARMPYQRFIPVTQGPAGVPDMPWAALVALDTKTGTLCRTVEVEKLPDRFANLPLCGQIALDSPD